MTRPPVEFPTKLHCLFQPKRYKVLYGGRGSGKSWGAARALLILGAKSPIRVLCTREFQNSIKESVHRLLAQQADDLGLGSFYETQETILKGKNGTEFIFKGLRHNIQSVKSTEGVDIAWVEEAQTVSEQSWSILIPTIRKPGSEIWVTFNPDLEEDATYQRFITFPQPNSIVQLVNYSDNPWFGETLADEMEALKARDLQAYENIWLGSCRSQVSNALWSKELLQSCREAPPPDDPREFKEYCSQFSRIVVAVDPSGCYGPDDERSDEVGIVTAARRPDKTAVVLADRSGRYSPDGWARIALQEFDRWEADRIVAEGNFGGAMVESTIRTARRSAPVKIVAASRGKVQRAEPVAALYEQGRVKHAGHFPELERQYTQFATSGYKGARSPDHADAGIWAVTELLVEDRGAGMGVVDYLKSESEKQAIARVENLAKPLTSDKSVACPRCGSVACVKIQGEWRCNSCGEEWDNSHPSMEFRK